MNTAPHVLMMTTDYPPHAVSGIGTHVRTLCSALTAHGVDITLLVAPPTPRDVHPDPWVTTLRTDYPDPPPPDSSPAQPTIRILQANVGLAAAAMTVPNVDLIHAHDLEAIPAAVTVGRHRGLPVVLTKHFVYGELPTAPDGSAEAHLYDYALRLERWSVAVADHVITVSRSTLDSVRERVHADVDEKATVVLNGAPTLVEGANTPAPPGKWRPARSGVVLLQVGRLHDNKGTDLSIEALAMLDRPDVELLLAGRGPQEAQLRSQARHLRVAEQVTFLGQVPREQLASLYRSADVVLAPSRSDTAPMTVCEILSMGRPIVVSDAEGLPELVHDGVHGLLFPDGDAAALAERIQRLLASPTLAARLADAGRTRGRTRLSDVRMAADTLRVYSEVLASSTEPAPAA